ncbi:MAG: hypothetical protein ACHQRJ_14695, partial [Alphaproteobacteria bacterium]
MKLSTILFGTGVDRKVMAKESRLWMRAGQEPSTTELLSDPIAILLMRADNLEASGVERLLREARRRRRQEQAKAAQLGRALALGRQGRPAPRAARCLSTRGCEAASGEGPASPPRAPPVPPPAPG